MRKKSARSTPANKARRCGKPSEMVRLYWSIRTIKLSLMSMNVHKWRASRFLPRDANSKQADTILDSLKDV